MNKEKKRLFRFLPLTGQEMSETKLRDLFEMQSEEPLIVLEAIPEKLSFPIKRKYRKEEFRMAYEKKSKDRELKLATVEKDPFLILAFVFCQKFNWNYSNLFFMTKGLHDFVTYCKNKNLLHARLFFDVNHIYKSGIRTNQAKKLLIDFCFAFPFKEIVITEPYETQVSDAKKNSSVD